MKYKDKKGGDPTSGDMVSGPEHADDIVISGISCRLPESDSMEEFRQNLIRGEDMVTMTNRRWEPGYNGLPTHSGTLKNITQFDARFFGIPANVAKCMDPQHRISLELTYEAITDAGVSMETLQGSRTSVYIGCGFMEAFETYGTDAEKVLRNAPLGGTSNMMSNRISYAFDLKGPSYTLRNGDASSLLALDRAVASLRAGLCDTAVVGGCNLCLKSLTSMQLMKTELLSSDGLCRCFDEECDGIGRSEGLVILFLQKRSIAKRVYCTIVHSSTMSMKSLSPSYTEEKNFLLRTYQEKGVDPTQVRYVEANGCSTKTGDALEVNAIADVFCKQRTGSLLIGSVKSNIGHAEAASGLASIAKLIIAIQDGMIPPNLHLNNPNKNIPSLADERVQVVTKRKRWPGGLVSLNSFGLGGANVHTILQSPSHVKDTVSHPDSNVKRLALYSGRTSKSVEMAIQLMRDHPRNVHLHTLMNETANMKPARHPFRGFAIINSSNNVQEIQQCMADQRPVWYVFSGMGSQWPGMGQSMMKIQKFKQTILSCDQILQPLGLSVYKLIMEGKADVYDKVIHSFVAITSIQIALVELLTDMGVKPDGILGHSVGELGCGYADGSLTREEAVLAAYWRGKCIQEANLPPGGMAAVGLTWEEAKKECPEGIVPVCHNSKQTVTVSGPAEGISKFVQQLKEKQVFAREVNSAGVAFHSYFMEAVAPSLLSALKKVIKPKKRSERWISTSVPESRWSSELCLYSSPEYHVNNFTSPVLFQEALGHVPDDAVVIEIAPHCLLQAVLKRSLASNCAIVGLMKKDHSDNADFFFSSVGRCYISGVKVNPLGLHTPVTFPVPLATPMISPAIMWDHSKSWDAPDKDLFLSGGTGRQTDSVYQFDFSPDAKDCYLRDHCVNELTLFPACGYIVIAWKSLAKLMGQVYEQVPVVFKNFMIHTATLMPPSGLLKFEVSLMQSTGEFAICEHGNLVASGITYCPTRPLQTFCDDSEGIKSPLSPCRKLELDLTTADIYKEFRLRGYSYGPSFQGILKSTLGGEKGELLWNDDWICFLDSMLQVNLLSLRAKELFLPISIKFISINPMLHMKRLLPVSDGKKGIWVMVDKFAKTTVSGGVEMQNPQFQSVVWKLNLNQPLLEECRFIPYFETNGSEVASTHLQDYKTKCVQLVNDWLRKLSQCVGKLGLPGMNVICQMTEMLPDQDGFSSIDEDFSSQKGFVLIQVLRKLISTSMNENVTKNVDNILLAFRDELKQDRLLTCIQQPRILHSCLDIALENMSRSKVHILEVQTQEHMLHTQILRHLNKRLSISINYTVAARENEGLNTSEYEDWNVNVVRWDLSESPPPKVAGLYDLIVLENTLHNQKCLSSYLKKILKVLRDTGFLLVTEATQNQQLMFAVEGQGSNSLQMEDGADRSFGYYCDERKWVDIFEREGLSVVSRKSDDLLNTTFLMRRKTEAVVQNQTVLSVSGSHTRWLKDLKQIIDHVTHQPKGHNLWLVTDNAEPSGIIGLVNCLRKEPGGEKLRCIYNMDKKESLTSVPDNLAALDLVMNVYKDGKLGSLRFLPKQEQATVMTDNAYMRAKYPGNVSSFTWFKSNPLEPKPTQELCSVFYITLDKLLKQSLESNGIHAAWQATENWLVFSGKTKSGRRVMGLTPNLQGLNSMVVAEKKYLWDVPEYWSLQEAVTVPSSYGIALYILVCVGKVTPGKTLLIHDSTTDIGMAAITVARDLGCNCFVTVSSAQKYHYLKSCHEDLSDSHIFSMENPLTFVSDILQATKGKGMDIVLNTHMDKQFDVGLDITVSGGKYLELSREKDDNLDVGKLKGNIQYHQINCEAEWILKNEKVLEMFKDGIYNGKYKPLKSKTFNTDQIKKAFQNLMSDDVNNSKTVVRIQDENIATENFSNFKVPAIEVTRCQPNKSYIITGGLGGFGLELAEWLVECGAMILILTSRSGVRTGYQARKIKLWKALGITVEVSLHDIKTEAGCRCLFEDALKLAPVGGIFHLAMVLHDAFLENQTEETFTKVLEPKVAGTVNLDNWSRTFCEKTLDWFVVFSSVMAGQGNAGQTNYGYGNSFMERICERRKQDGLPGLAIEWGAVGDVGVVMDITVDNTQVVGGTLPQRMMSCLNVLDQFLNQPHPVMSTCVPEDKSQDTQKKIDSKKILLRAVLDVFGIDHKQKLNLSTSLVELGLDSLMSAEIKQIMLLQYDIDMSTNDIKKLNIKKLTEMSGQELHMSSREVQSHIESVKEETVHSIPEQVRDCVILPKHRVTKLNKSQTDKGPVFIMLSVAEYLQPWTTLASMLDIPVIGIHCTSLTPVQSIQALAGFCLQQIDPYQSESHCYIVGHSLAGLVAMEMMSQLQTYFPESSDVQYKLVLIDTAPGFLPALSLDELDYVSQLDQGKQDNLILGRFLQNIGLEDKMEYQDCTSLDEKLQKLALCVGQSDRSISASGIIHAARSFHQSMMTALQYRPTAKVKDVILVRPMNSPSAFCQRNQDYNLQQFCTGTVQIHNLDCFHDKIVSDANIPALEQILTPIFQD